MAKTWYFVRSAPGKIIRVLSRLFRDASIPAAVSCQAVWYVKEQMNTDIKVSEYVMSKSQLTTD
jgi:hypothetical protein